MEKRHVKIIYSLLLLICLACQRESNLPILQRSPQIVINSILTPDSLLTVEVSLSKNLKESYFPILFVENATVKIYENGNLLDILPYKGEGTYQSKNTKPQQANTYKLEVAVPNFPLVTASTYIPSVVPIKDFSIKADSIDEPETLLEVIFDDPPETNYYYIEVFQIDTKINWIIAKIPFSFSGLDNIIEVALENFYLEGSLLYDKYFNEQTVILNGKYSAYLNLTLQQQNLQYILSLKAVSKDYYYYYVSSNAQLINEGYLSSEPVQIISNIENGLGIFASYSQAKVILEEK